jgi:teichuronic acid biosynthesis glycosyltransferase TuaC
LLFRPKEDGNVRILCVTNMYPSAEQPGYGAFVYQQVEGLRQFGHAVDLINILGFQSKINYLKAAFEIFQRTSREAYDIVHSHYGYSAFPALFRVQAPLVITLHGSDVLGNRFESLLTWGVSRLADAVIVVSEEMKRRIPGIVIPCGVDLNVFKPYNRDEARARLRWPKDRYLILFPFDPKRAVKRYDLAEAAVEQLVREGVNAKLIPVFNVANREMPWCYSAADAMLLCSDREGSPTSVKEALACNLPVVATDVGDIRDIFNSVTGPRICVHDVGGIARSLREVLKAPRAKFQGRVAMARYDQTLTVEKILAIYNGVLCRAKTSAQTCPGP